MKKSNSRILDKEAAENWWHSLPEGFRDELIQRIYHAIDMRCDWEFPVDEITTPEDCTVVTLSYSPSDFPYYDDYRNAEVIFHTYPRTLSGLKEKWAQIAKAEKEGASC